MSVGLMITVLNASCVASDLNSDGMQQPPGFLSSNMRAKPNEHKLIA